MGVSYLDRFGLEREPFSQQIEDEFFFADATLMEHLDALAHPIERGTQILLIIGVRGSGKTTLLEQFLARDNVNCRAYRIRANAMLQERALLRAVADELGIIYDASVTDLSQLLIRDLGRQHVDKVPVLAIDDAHELPRSSVQSISNLWELGVDPPRPLRVVLAGEPQLEKMLSACLDPIIAERGVHVIEMRAYSALQTGAYLRHRMEIAGFKDALPFTPSQVKRIHQVSRGIPAKINEHAHQLLLQTDVQKTKSNAHATTPLGRYTAYLAFGIVAAVLLSAAWYLRDDITHQYRNQQLAQVEQKNPLELSAEEEDKLDTESEQHIADAVVDKPIAAQVTGLPERRDDAKDIQRLAGGSANDPDVTIDDNPPSGSVIKFADGALQEAQEPDAKIEETPLDPQMTPAPSFNVDNKAEPTVAMPSISTTQQSARLSSVDAPTAPAVEVMPAETRPGEGSGLAPAQATRLKPHRSESKTAESPVRQGALLSVKDEVWLLHRNPAHYTLQLIAARKEEAVLAYLKHHLRSGEVATFHSYYKGGDWYSLVYGIYPTRLAAEQALRQLPDAVQEQGSWVRTVLSVQNAIKAPIPTVPVQ